MKKLLSITILLGFLLLPNSLSAKTEYELDWSACVDIYQFLEKMKAGKSKDELETELNRILKTKPYEYMFYHYNRKRRPNELPEEVFKRMILSIKFGDIYKKGENRRADRMIPYWKKYYQNLPLFKKNIEAMKTVKFDLIIDDVVSFANSWLPENLKVPSFNLFILPQGGSNAYEVPREKIDRSSQGIDFFQLDRKKNGTIEWQKLSVRLAHEGHHLGFEYPSKKFKDPKKAILHSISVNYLGEGAANKIIANLPGGCVPKVYSENNIYTDILDGCAKSDWDSHDHNKTEIFNRFIADLRYLMKKGIDEAFGSKWDEYWYAPVCKPRYYFLGSELIGAVYYGFGKEGVLEVLSSPIELYSKYNNALLKRPDILGDCMPIPEDIMQFLK